MVVKLTVASWPSEPLVACKVSETVPVGVASVVVTVNCCDEPADTISGDDGFVVAPVGNPDIATITDPVNPFAGLTDIVAEPLELPSTALKDAGETATEKSGAGGGGGDPPPPPHAVRLS